MQEEIKKHRSRYQAEDSSNGKLCHLDFISRQQQSNEHWVIGPEMLQHAFAYLDDIIVIEKTLEEHMANLKEVLRRLRAANLRINVDKCDFFKKRAKISGAYSDRRAGADAVIHLGGATNATGHGRFEGRLGGICVDRAEGVGLGRPA